MERVFIIRPFGRKKDSGGREIDFERTQNELIGPALAAAELAGGTTGEIIDAGNIREDMFSLILEADLVVCDVTVHNANVFYELGIRHALRKRSTLLIRGRQSADDIPFDLLTDRYLKYDLDDPGATTGDLVAMIRASLRTERTTDSPVFRMMEGLPEANPAAVEAVPLDFREEVARARGAGSRGWLRLLAEDVRGQRFQWTGLKLVAAAQWALRDHEGARETLEMIPPASSDPATTLMLANAYERLYRTALQPQLLVASDQALQRVLDDRRADQKQVVEAHTLRARNEKTRWRLEFEQLGTLAERRAAAMNQRLRDTYAAYRAAYYQDLNGFYPGLAALQMADIFLDLSSDPADTSWKAAFDTDREADEFRADLADEAQRLRLVVHAAVDAQLERLPADDPQRVWARISNADLVFLTESNPARVIRRYRDAIPPSQLSAWDSARGQLALHACVGFRAELANAVMAAMDGQKPAEQPAEEKPLNFVVFTGHRVDEPGRAPPRFPQEHAPRAAELLRARLERLAERFRVVGLASGAPGGDILFHEVCDELGIPCTLCLPMPADEYSRQAFGAMDGWRTRFLDLRRRRPAESVLELSDREGLPRWLEGTGANPWERGNRWVLQMALTSGARHTTLLALWDGEPGTLPGGTAHMVSITRDAGTVDVDPIPLSEVLKP